MRTALAKGGGGPLHIGSVGGLLANTVTICRTTQQQYQQKKFGMAVTIAMPIKPCGPAVSAPDRQAPFP